MQLLRVINSYFIGPVLPVVIFGTGLFLCFRLRFFHILHPFKVLSALMRPKKNGVSPFKALSVALAGTLGVGNIADGSAAAVVKGGGKAGDLAGKQGKTSLYGSVFVSAYHRIPSPADFTFAHARDCIKCPLGCDCIKASYSA